MDLFSLIAKITIDSSEYDKGIDDAEKKGSKLGTTLSAVGNGVKTAGKVIGAAVGASAVAIGKVLASSVNAYKQYEQLTGGVETLFGAGGRSLEEYQKKVGITEKSTQKEIDASIKKYNDLQKSQDIVMENAHNAFREAGVDANTYMENVTSFSASLISSLKGDTVKAAEVSHMAMVDMADNANKMGTDMSSIQAAYQGFAKQNYTMLDNLKLGYGGTRTEMQRLLKDASKLTGKKYNLNNLADVYEAIHAIQQELDITGTTAKEAETTIQGSIGMMKASWENLKIAIVDPNANLDKAINDFVSSAGTAAKNLIPAISNGLKGIGQVIKDLAPVLAAELPGLITELLPNLISAAVELVGALASAIIDNAHLIIDGFGQILQKIGEVFQKSDNPILQGAGKLIEFLGDIFRDPLGTLEKAWDTVWTGITDLASSLWEGIKTTASNVWEAIKGFWTENIAKPVGEAWEGIKKAFSDIWEGIKSTASNVWEAIKGFWTENISGPLSKVWETVKSKVSGIWDSIKTTAQNVWESMKTTAETVWNAIKGVAETVWNAIKDFIKNPIKAVSIWLSNIWEGIKLTASIVWNAIKSTAESVWNGIKSFIEDPINTVATTLGNIWKSIKDTAVSAWNAVKDAIDPIIRPIRELIQSVIDKVKSVIQWFKDLVGWNDKHLSTTTSEHIHTETTVKRVVQYTDVRNGNVDLPAPTADDPYPGLTTGINGFNPFKMGGRAKGDWYVPYDTPSLLHRGEMVLTASQARRYREGEGGIDIPALASAIVGAVREGMANAQVNSYLDGKNVTEVVNEILGNEVASRRFA